MSLQINKLNGIYELTGVLDLTTAKPLLNHIKLLQGFENSIDINIDNLSLIDRTGVAALLTILSLSLRTDCDITISGRGYKDIYNEYRDNQAA